MPDLTPLRRIVRKAARGTINGLPPGSQELARAMASRAAGGVRMLPGPIEGPVLVVAPHPDDEVIGPGASIARHCDRGDEVRVLILTSGGATSGGGSDVTGLRKEESRRALTHLGRALTPRFSGLPDGGLTGSRDQVSSLVSEHGKGVAGVYIPSPLDPHPDHSATALALADADLADDVMVMGYEVWGAGPVTALLDVTEVFARKQAALAEFHIALQAVDYVRSASGLAAYRSAATMGGAGFAEGFLAMPLGEYRELVRAR